MSAARSGEALGDGLAKSTLLALVSPTAVVSGCTSVQLMMEGERRPRADSVFVRTQRHRRQGCQRTPI